MKSSAQLVSGPPCPASNLLAHVLVPVLWEGERRLPSNLRLDQLGEGLSAAMADAILAVQMLVVVRDHNELALTSQSEVGKQPAPRPCGHARRGPADRVEADGQQGGTIGRPLRDVKGRRGLRVRD